MRVKIGAYGLATLLITGCGAAQQRSEPPNGPNDAEVALRSQAPAAKTVVPRAAIVRVAVDASGRIAGEPTMRVTMNAAGLSEDSIANIFDAGAAPESLVTVADELDQRSSIQAWTKWRSPGLGLDTLAGDSNATHDPNQPNDPVNPRLGGPGTLPDPGGNPNGDGNPIPNAPADPVQNPVSKPAPSVNQGPCNQQAGGVPPPAQDQPNGYERSTYWYDDYFRSYYRPRLYWQGYEWDYEPFGYYYASPGYYYYSYTFY